MSSTLLQYLSEPNPRLDHAHSLHGFPTRCDPEEPLRTADWSDFNFENLMACYGHVLQERFDRPFPGTSPPLKTLERSIFDEDSLDHLLSRSIIPAVSEGLSVAWAECYPGHMPKMIDITRGGRARHPPGSTSEMREESSIYQGSSQAATKIFPDWAGVQQGSRNPTYANRCPGETKLSTKWRSWGERVESYYWPIAQVSSYSVKNWKTRYGYIITGEELVVLRFSREKIGSGLASGRSPRATSGTRTAPSSTQHRHNDSITSVMSGTSTGRSRESSPSSNNGAMSVSVGGRSAHQSSPASQRQRQHSIASEMSKMSIDRSSGRSRESSISSTNAVRSAGEQSYEEGSSGGEYRPVEMKSIRWENHGPGKLTVKLALWWIHMIAAAPECDKSVGNHYDDLNTWAPVNGHFQHTSTGLISKSQPKSGHIRSSHGPSTPPRNQQTTSSPFSSPLSSPPSSMLMSTPPDANLPDINDIQDIRWDDARRQWRYRTNAGRSGSFPQGTLIWNSRRGEGYRAARNAHGQIQWVLDGRGALGIGRSNYRSDEGSDGSSGSSNGKGGSVHGYGKQRRYWYGSPVCLINKGSAQGYGKQSGYWFDYFLPFRFDICLFQIGVYGWANSTWFSSQLQPSGRILIKFNIRSCGTRTARKFYWH